MYQRDFLKLANGLRADLKSCIKSRTQRSSLLFRILTYFQEYSEQERPEKYKSFAEFASNNHLEYPIGIPKVDDTSLRRIGAKISEAKQGAAPDIVPLILFYLWTETRREFLALLEEGRDLHDFIGEILDHELSSEQQSRALDVPKLLFIGAKGRGENETRDVSEIAERFTQKSMIVDVVLVDGANPASMSRSARCWA